MRMIVEFDVDADMIDVPQHVIDHLEALRTEFLRWLYDRKNPHRYWVKMGSVQGVCYRSDALVEWLNGYILRDTSEKAVILEQHISRDICYNLPSVFF